MNDLRQRLYRTKLTLLALLFVLVGLALLVADQLLPADSWRDVLPIADVGSALFTTGFIGIALQYLDERDAEQRASSRLRRILHEEAPAIRDAVVDGFAFSPDALLNVTSPDVLHRVIDNSLAVELQDADLAASAHEHVLSAASTPSQRFAESRLTVDLREGPTGQYVTATIRREYRCQPEHPTLRFSGVASRGEYEALLRDPESTEVWWLLATESLTASDEDAFTVRTVELDGQPLDVRRSARKGSQVYTCRLPLTRESEPTTHYIAYEFEVVVARSKHSLFFDFGRPTKGLTVEASAAAAITGLRLYDFIQSPDIRRSHRPSEDGQPSSVTVAVDGWVLPRAGVVLVWQ